MTVSYTHLDVYKRQPTEDTDDSMVKFLDSGCGLNVGVIIERFE